MWLTRVSRISTHDCIVFDDGTAITRHQLEIAYDVSTFISEYCLPKHEKLEAVKLVSRDFFTMFSIGSVHTCNKYLNNLIILSLYIVL